MRYRSLFIAFAAVGLLAVALPVLSSATATPPAPSERVIVVLKNQDGEQPATRAMVAARRSALRLSQLPIMAQLARSGARNVHSYTVLNALSATASPAEIASLRAKPAVAEVVPDQVIHLGSSRTAGGSVSTSRATPVAGACAPNGKVQLDPEALQAMSVDSGDPAARTARSLGATGAGVKVAFIADGLDTANPDFLRADGKPVFVDYKDFSGAGTGASTGGGEAFLDASSIAAQGRKVYDVSRYSHLPLNRPCKIRVEGVAPSASLVGLDIFGDEGEGFNSSLLQAIDYAVSVAHVNVLNESLGINNYPDDQASLDLVKQANDDAVAAGTTVTVSTGDAGVTNTIGSPSSDPNVIAAGASTTFRTYAQDGFGGVRFPGVTGWLDNNISSLSSGGFEQDGPTIDLVAPGESNWALCSTNVAMYGDCVNYAGKPTPVQDSGGTSESAPLTAGVAALVIGAYERSHAGSVPSPALVKQLIVSNTDDIGAPAYQQGAGLVDAYKAVLAARAYNKLGAAPRQAAAVLFSRSTQLNATAGPGTPESLTDTLTNESGHAERLSLSTRRLGAYQPLRATTVHLSGAGPHFTDWGGMRNNDKKVTFRVPSGEDRLNASAAFRGASMTKLNARVRFFLIDPNGKYAIDSRPQGNGNYGNAQVAHPAPGRWTAIIHSRVVADGGTTGPVRFGVSVAHYAAFGTVSPSALRLSAGQSAAVTLHVSTPAGPGNASGAVVVGSSIAGTSSRSATTIPVTLRSLIPRGDQSFTARLTGGNGRDPISGQEFYYQINLPSGDPELNATVTLDGDQNNPFGAYLINPAGQSMAYATNMVPSGDSPTGETNVQGAQLHALTPAPGTWSVIVVFAPQVSGRMLSQPFTVAVNQRQVTAGSGGLPDSGATTLAAGQAHTYDVTITNTGPAQESFFPDARLPGSTQLALGALDGATTTEPLTFAANLPIYLVPTDSTVLTEQASTSGSQPIQFDSQTASGDPDIASTLGTTVTASLAANPVTPGAWDIVPVEYGPFGSAPGPAEPVSTTASVTTSPFDTTVSSPTGDLEADSANPATTLPGFAPATVKSGQTATLPVTITPTAAPGTHVSGTLYIDDTASFEFGSIANGITNFPSGNQVVAIPYQYTVR